MLVDLYSDEPIRGIPFRQEYDLWKSRLDQGDPGAYKRIFDELDRRAASKDIITSSWEPGADWTDTVFQPMYTIACRCNEGQAAQFYGLILWHVIQQRPEKWTSEHFENNGLPIKGRTYFRRDNRLEP